MGTSVERLLVAAVVALTVLVTAAQPSSADIATTRSKLGAGYLAAPTGGVTQAKTSLTVPTVTCVGNADFELLELGVFAFDSGSALTSYAAVIAQCASATTPTYSAAVNTPNGGSKALAVSPGDQVVVSINDTDISTWATVHDVTANTTRSSHQPVNVDASVLIGDLGGAAIPQFSKVGFRQANVNGEALGAATPLTKEVLKNQAAVQISTTALDTSGRRFALVWRSSY